MRRPRILSTSPAMTEEELFEIAIDLEANFAAKTTTEVLAHRTLLSKLHSYAHARERSSRPDRVRGQGFKQTFGKVSSLVQATRTRPWFSPHAGDRTCRLIALHGG